MATWASPDDVATLYEGTPPDRTEALLSRAERELTRLVPRLAARIDLPADDPETLDQGLVRDVLVDAVIRKLRNPRGIVSEQDGDYSYRLATAGATDGAWFTAAELASLRLPLPGTAWAGVGAVLLAPGVGGPDYPRWQRGDPMAWTGDEPAGVREAL